MPLPLFKLGALLAKQIAKPLSKILKHKAQQNEKFRTKVVMRVANCKLNHHLNLTYQEKYKVLSLKGTIISI